VRIALGSDEIYPVHAVLRAELENRGCSVVLFGALASSTDAPWAQVAVEAASAVASGDCDEGIFCCWSGTGICMAANKVSGIRAALCTDAVTVEAARVWNHANVLCLSNRLLSQDLAKEMVRAWFAPFDKERGAAGVEQFSALEQQLSERETREPRC
jgi:ribose 5-phosphate isomerase B